MVSKLHVGIIGCGPAGLVTLKELHEEGHTGMIFEKTSQIGGIFKTVYQQGYMVSSTVITCFSDFLGSEGEKILAEPRMLSFVEYTKYLNEYADHFDLRRFVQFEHDVQLIERINSELSDTKWRLRVCDLQTNKIEEYVFDRIAVCSGTHQQRAMPMFHGTDRFQGVIKHMQDVKKFEDFAGKRVCVVGGGEAASDMALASAKYGSKSFLSVRGDHGYVIPRYAFGTNRPSDVETIRARYSMPTSMNFIVRNYETYLERFFIWLQSEGSNDKERRTRKIQQQTSDLNFKQLATSNYLNTFGTKNEGLAEAIALYGCQKKPAIRELREHSIIFTDGTDEEVDEIVCCTGFENRFAFLDANTADEILQKVGRDARISHNLYKHAVHPLTGAGLVFIGFVRPAFGAIPPLAEMQARWFALLCSNICSLPDPVTMVKNSRAYAHFLEHKFTKTRTDRITNLTDHLLFSDDMARQIGCRPDLGFHRLLTEPRIWLRCMLGPLSIIQYRLQGPHAQAEQARHMLLTMKWHPDVISNCSHFTFLVVSFLIWWIFRLKNFRPLTWYPIQEWESED